MLSPSRLPCLPLLLFFVKPAPRKRRLSRDFIASFFLQSVLLAVLGVPVNQIDLTLSGLGRRWGGHSRAYVSSHLCRNLSFEFPPRLWRGSAFGQCCSVGRAAFFGPHVLCGDLMSPDFRVLRLATLFFLDRFNSGERIEGFPSDASSPQSLLSPYS